MQKTGVFPYVLHGDTTYICIYYTKDTKMTAVQQMIEDLKQLTQIPPSIFDKYLILESDQMINAFYAGWIQCDATKDMADEVAKDYIQTIRNK